MDKTVVFTMLSLAHEAGHKDMLMLTEEWESMPAADRVTCAKVAERLKIKLVFC